MRLKAEIGTRRSPDRTTARAEIFTFIETFYNRKRLRRHPVWGYLTRWRPASDTSKNTPSQRKHRLSSITGKLHLAAAPTVRAAALGATAALLHSPSLASRISGTTQVLRRLLTESTDRRERANTVLTIGAWGQDTTIWLQDPDPAIRACAALSPACADNTNATRTILRALLEPVVIDSWFLEPTAADPCAGEPLSHIEGRLRYALLSAAIERAADFDELPPAATASVLFCSTLTIAQDWGPLLAAAFPSGYDQGTDLTLAQHRYLSALADRDVCWRHTQLITSWFDDIGLPTDRDAIRALLTGPAPGRNTARFE
ncbi:hypothetical protein [Streptomyces sp. NPDC058620]|uniref:hypothetical protein n=1 Tax=Streptomyces sp. NPDC058620 TaxID=3346560 RepID=UPI003653D143